jgi:hypothetical protein
MWDEVATGGKMILSIRGSQAIKKCAVGAGSLALVQGRLPPMPIDTQDASDRDLLRMFEKGKEIPGRCSIGRTPLTGGKKSGGA